MKKLLLFIVLCPCVVIHAQELHKICPISLANSSRPDSTSFLLTITDYNFFRGIPVKYAPSVEIVDADAPWPPRWFAIHPDDTAPDMSTSGRIMLNATMQDDKLLFFTVIPDGPNMNNIAILICDKNMQLIDTFYRPGKEIDSHDFRFANGEMMYFLSHDTVIDMRRISNNNADSAVKLKYETIEIAGMKGQSVFSWDPLARLGFEAVYLPYRYAPGVMSDKTHFGWSHGNSLQYDFDGNILYSFKHIGIGKISRTDGHVMWHIDRNKLKANALSDAIPVYLQHDLQAVKDREGNISYTVLSNGDEEHPECAAYQFTVNYDTHGTPVIKLLKKISPSEKIPNSGGCGNFDIEASGNYLLNYGPFKQDTTLMQRALFEYKDGINNKTAEYTIAPSLFSYRVHKITEMRPARPIITAKGPQLYSDKKEAVQKWYKLSGPDLHTVDYMGEGEKFSPKTDGYYCVSERYGIGWSVSKPYKYSRQ